MPRTPVDYSKTIMYKLVHNEDYDNANIYIGSTTDFRKRKSHHKGYSYNEKNKSYNNKKYQYIRENGGWDNWNMIEVEKYPCNDGNEARAREEYWRSHFNAQLNMVRAYRTDEEKVEYKKKYYDQNKDKLLEQHKEYYEQNKDRSLEYKKKYRENNRDKISKQSSQQITCECGCIIRKDTLTKHKKTQKHLKLLDAIYTS
jgi:hypothetical protein